MKQTIDYRLSYAEMQLASLIHSQRRIATLKDKVPHVHGATQTVATEAQDLIGARAEMAVAKIFDYWWDGDPGDVDAIDVGGVIEVRATEHPRGRLRLHHRDKDHLPYVHCIVRDYRHVHLMGWLYAGEGKRPDYWEDPTGGSRPAFFVPNNALRPIGDLLAMYGPTGTDRPAQAARISPGVEAAE